MINKQFKQTISSHPPSHTFRTYPVSAIVGPEKRDLRASPRLFPLIREREYHDIYRGLIEAICCKFNLAFLHLLNTYSQLLVIAFRAKQIAVEGNFRNNSLCYDGCCANSQQDNVYAGTFFSV